MIISVIFLYSCHKKTNDNTGLNTIQIETSSILDQVLLSDFSTGTDIIRLETNKSCFIGSLDKVHFYGDTIAILDKKIQQLLFFTQNGQFLSKIHRIGKGPGEYMKILDFFIDYNSNVNVLTGKEIMQYQKDGDFIGEFDLPFHATHAIHCSDSLIVFRKTWQNYINGVTNPYDFKLVMANIDYDNFDYLLKFDLVKYDIGPLDFLLVFSINEKIAYYFELFNDTVYSISKDGLTAKYYFDFGSNKLPSELYKLKRSELLKQTQKKQKIASSPHDFFISKGNIFCTYLYNGNLIYFLKGKDGKEIIQSKKIVNDFDSLPFSAPIAMKNNQLVYNLSPLDILQNGNIRDSYKNMTANDNPILVFVNLK